MFCKGPLSPGGARRARLFVGLRYAPASSKSGPAGGKFLPSARAQHPSLILFPQQSHFVPAPTDYPFGRKRPRPPLPHKTRILRREWGE
jgi:hypothetical protein